MKKTLRGRCLFQAAMAAGLLLLSIGVARAQGVAAKDFSRERDDDDEQ